ncbi:MAG: AtpZ/AtpI family protein [Cloacibacterium sp.]|nr:AtpZ/AtpI family protein [Cloacibacterium sp.]
MALEDPNAPKTPEEQQEEYKKNPMGLYGIYSSIVFQMLAIIALGFWGGKKINDYLEFPNDLLTVVIGLAGLGLALYSTLKKLENINK